MRKRKEKRNELKKEENYEKSKRVKTHKEGKNKKN